MLNLRSNPPSATAVLGICDAHRFAHPRVNAALVQVRAGARLSVGPERAARRDAIRVGDVFAFGRLSRVSGCAVQGWNNAAAELCDFCERMDFAAIVGRGDRSPDRQAQRRRIKAPGGHSVVRRELGGELRERHGPMSGARARSERGVERRGFALIENADCTVEPRNQREIVLVTTGRSQRSEQCENCNC